MRLTWVLLALLERIAAHTYGAVALKADCAIAQPGCKNYFRAFVVSTSPANSAFEPVSNVTGLSVAAVGAQAAAAGGGVVNGKVDVAGFRFKTPADTGDSNKGLSFYFGYLGVTGTWDTSTKTGAVAGALAEVVSTLSSLNVWYDNDNVTGFKWDIGQATVTKRYDILNCAEGERLSYDCLDPKGTVELKNLSWTPISHTKVQCNTIPALSTAPDGCEIHFLSTSGALASAPTVPVITFTARIASQPVLIDNVLHGPGFAKFDVKVRFPWASFTGLYAPAKAKLALIGFSAGKSGTFAAAGRRSSDNADSLVFTTAGSTSRSYYAYTTTAHIDSVPGPVTTQVITGQQILDFDCAVGAPCWGLTGTNAIAIGLKVSVTWLATFQWKASVTIHALGDTNTPTEVFWDPELGAGKNDESSAAFVVPSLVFLVALLLQ